MISGMRASLALLSFLVYIWGASAADLMLDLPSPEYEFSNYRILIFSEETAAVVINGTISASSAKMQLRDLVPGSVFTVHVLTEFNNGTAAKFVQIYKVATRPDPPKSISALPGTDSVLVSWEPPTFGQYDTFDIEYETTRLEKNSADIYRTLVTNATNPARILQLHPGTVYAFYLYSVFYNKSSEPASVNVSTVPLPPEAVSVIERSSSSAKLSWQAPSSGYYDGFFLEYSGKDTSTTQTEILIEELQPGKTIKIDVFTVSNNVFSNPTSVNVTSTPSEVVNLHAEAVNTTSLNVSWETSIFSHQTSFIVNIADLTDTTTSSVVSKIMSKNTSSILIGLLPGHLYEIGVTSESNGVTSGVTTTRQATVPSAPLITAINTTSDSITVHWKEPTIAVSNTTYFINLALDGATSTVHRFTVPNELFSLDIEDLVPGSVYLLELFVTRYGEKSTAAKRTVTLAPLPVGEISIPIDSVTNQSMVVTWTSVPTVDKYQLSVYALDQEQPFKYPVETNLLLVDELEAATEYTVELQTVRSDLLSEPVVAKQYTRPNPPRDVAVRYYQNVEMGIDWKPPSGRYDGYLVTYYGPNRNGTDLLNKAALTYSLNKLTPGALYNISVKTVLFEANLTSEATIVLRRTRPLLESRLSIDEITNTSVTVTFSPTRSGVFDWYVVTVVTYRKDVRKKIPYNETNLSATFDGLTPGEAYEVTLFIESDKVRSQSSNSKEFRAKPSDVELADINTSSTAYSVRIDWQPPQHVFDTYELRYKAVKRVRADYTILMTKKTAVEIPNLLPFTNYSFVLYTISWEQYSEGVEFFVSTTAGSPDVVRNLIVFNVTDTKVILHWEPPKEQNGIIKSYKVTYDGITACQMVDVGHRSFKPLTPTRAHSFELDGLKAATHYNITVQASTTGGLGKAVSKVIDTELVAPHLKNLNVSPQPKPETASTESFAVVIKRTWFSNCNGPVKSYAIIVAEDPGYNSSGPNLMKWSQVKNDKVWKAYQATPVNFNPFENSGYDEYTFIVGSENCDNNPGYCNGNLKPKTEYYVKFRAFNEKDMYTDTAYSLPVATKGNYIGIIIGVVVGVLLGILVIILVCVSWRRCRKKRNTLDARDGATSQTLSSQSLSPTSQQFRFPSELPVAPTVIISKPGQASFSRPVKLNDFIQHVKLMSADSDFRFSEEYEALKLIGRDQSCAAADLPVNRGKNRFTNILPYDHSRVKLLPTDDEEGSDYVNANYMQGHNSPREFIVTQGPLPSTRDDFWRMIWETNSRSIVMLTRCVEKGREKCDQYWPVDSEQMYYGDLEVAVLNESKYPFWSISEFRVNLGDQVRNVKHFHFTAWPDFGVPERTQTLIKFVRAVREKVPISNHPVLVHCSAGVGRSGTFIVLDILLQQIKETDMVDIFGLVYEMRKMRVWMVQTEQQYICIHNCLKTVLEGKEDDLPDHDEFMGNENPAFDDDEGIVESGL